MLYVENRISVANTRARGGERFYCGNFVDLVGEGLSADLRHRAPCAAT